MASGADVKTGTPGHRQIVDLIVLMGLGVLQAWAFFDGNLGLSGDNAAYMVLGAALATDSGYVHIGHPAQPLETKFPPGFPVLLAGVYLLFDGDLLAMKWFVALLYALSVPVVYLLVRAHDSRPMAIVVSALCLVSTPLLELSHSAMSEIPYMVASFVALLLLARGRSSHLSLVLAGASAVAAYYIRTVGVTVVATVAGWLLIQRRLKVADVVAAVAAIPIAAWVHFAATHGQGAYIRALVSVNAYRPELGYLTPLALLERAYGNLQLYGLQFVPEILLPYPFNHVSYGFDFPAVLWLPALMCTGLVCYYLFRGERSSVRLYLALYTGVLIVWPQIWSSTRFLVPVVPLVLYAAAWSVRDIARRFVIDSTASRTVLWVCLALTLCSNLVGARELYGRKHTLPLPWSHYFRAAQWVRANTDPEALVSCRKPGLFYLVSRRKAVSYRFADPEVVMQGFVEDGVSVVILDRLPFASGGRHLTPALEAYGDWFSVLYTVPNGDTQVLGLLPSAGE